MFENIFISFKTRILLGFCSLIMMMVVIICMSLTQFSKVQQNTAELNNTIMPSVKAAEGMVLDVLQVQQFLTDVSATHDPQGYKDADLATSDFTRRMVQILTAETTSSEQAAELAKLNSAFDRYYNQGKRMADIYVNQGIEAGNVAMKEFDATASQLTALMEKFKDGVINEELQTTTELSEGANDASRLMMAISVLLVILSLGLPSI